MEKVIEQMKTAAPEHVVQGLCTRLREIEGVESANGETLANECRKFIYEQNELKWIDVLVAAYFINGGVIVREPFHTTKSPPRATPPPPPPTSSAASAASTPPPPLVKSPNRAAVSDFTSADMREIENMVNSLDVGDGGSQG
jgi:hypothetical protein